MPVMHLRVFQLVLYKTVQYWRKKKSYFHSMLLGILKQLITAGMQIEWNPIK